MKKLIISFLIVYAFVSNTNAQIDIQLSNYMFSGLTFNPAFAGFSKCIDVNLITHQQWVGFGNTPSTQILSASNKFKFGNYGLSLINDRLGCEKSFNAKFIYAYPFQISDHAFITGGLGLGFINRSLDFSNLVFENDMVFDPISSYNNKNEYSPVFDIGLMFSNKRMKLGMSTTHTNNSANNATFYKASRHYYLFGSYSIQLNSKYQIVPSLFFKSNQVITQYEANTNVYYDDKLWAGLSYRATESVIVLFGIKINKNIKIGYSFDYNIGQVKYYAYGTHELIILFKYCNKENPLYYRTPRLFN